MRSSLFAALFWVALWVASWAALSTGLLGCGGGTLLQGAPRPDPAVMAGIAAGVATAVTVADPAGAARLQEQKAAKPEKRVLESRETVPLEVLDRRDAAEAKAAPAAPGAAAATPAPAAPAAPAPSVPKRPPYVP